MERPQPNRSHDQGKRLNIHYQYSDHDLRSDGIEWRTRYHHLQQKFKNVSAEQADLKVKMERVTEERDKAQKKLEQSGYFIAQNRELQGFAHKLQYEKEQLEQNLHLLRSEHEKNISHILDELRGTRSDLECAVQDRDSYKYKVTELQRENQRLSEKIHSLAPTYDSSKKELDNIIDQRDRLASNLAELKAENSKLKDQLKLGENHFMTATTHSNHDVINLKERNIELVKQLKEMQDKLRYMEAENHRHKASRDVSPVKSTSSRESLGRQSGSEESMGGIGGRTNSRSKLHPQLNQEDESPPFGRSHSNSATELDQRMRSNSGVSSREQMLFMARKKLSASASNLLENDVGGVTSYDTVLSQLQGQLNRAFRDKEKLSHQLSEMRDSRSELESKLKTTETENGTLKDEITKMKVESTAVQEQMKLLKGVTMQQSTETYEKSMQLQTQLVELQTERTLAEKQRDIALRERDRVVTDAISLKKKLETIKAQRQKDAKELSSMRKLRDKTVQENQDVVKQLNELKESVVKIDAQKTKTLAALKEITGKDTESDIHDLITHLRQEHSDYLAMLKCLYGRDKVEDVTSCEAVAKLEALYHEKSNLVLEVEELQRSAGKQNEDYIFDLKQTIETLMMEQDSLQGKNRSLMSRIGKLETERGKLRQECDRLDSLCQELNASRSFTPSPETIPWGENWEMKHVQIPLGTEGKAGFSVVGGKDQPQLPNPGAFMVTFVNKGGPANGVIKVGDVLESINSQSLRNADHAQAVSAVKESKGLLDIVLRRRKNAHALQVGVAGAVMKLGEVEKKKESMEFSLMQQKDGLGFSWEWETQYSITTITEGGSADKILMTGDKIIQVNGTPITKEKPSAVKKLLKPHKGVLRVVVEREVEPGVNQLLLSEPPPPSVSEILTPATKSASASSSDHGSSRNKGGSSWDSDDYSYSQNSQDHTSYRQRPDSYHSATQESNASQEPVKVPGATPRLRPDGRGYVADGPRPTSDGIMFSAYPERRVEFEEYSSEIGSTGYSEGVSESFLSEPSTYPDGYLPMESSQTSIELTFHTVSQVSHNRLTVQSTISTQPEKDSHSDEEEAYFARDDDTRTTFRNRSGSEGAVCNGISQYREMESKAKSLKRSGKRSPSKLTRIRKGWPGRSGSLSQLSEPEYEEYIESNNHSKKKSRSNSALAFRGRSRSNLSLTPARSMTSVQEEPRRSISTTSVNSEQDPLADATYIRANFSYIPRQTQELHVKPGDVFHIIEDAPIRHRRSFWVSRLNEDGTDAGVGAIPNTTRAQEWLNEQGNTLDIALYEEVEAFTGVRPVVVCGVLASQIATLLVESYPKLFHYYHPEFVDGTARITEARLHRDQSEGRIVHYERHGDSGFSVIPREAFISVDTKGKHILVAGSMSSIHVLKTFAPPISILIKAGAEDSINTFGLAKLSTNEVQRMYADAKMLEEEHSHEFTACLMLVYEDTLLKQIANIVRHEKLNQTWVPVIKEPISP